MKSNLKFVTTQYLYGTNSSLLVVNLDRTRFQLSRNFCGLLVHSVSRLGKRNICLMHSQIVTVSNGGTKRDSKRRRGRRGIISRAASFPRLLPLLHLRSCSITSGLIITSARFSRRYGAT